MADLRLNMWSKLDFKSPREYLAGIRPVQYLVASADLPERVKRLATRTLRPHDETRHAALFLYGMSLAIENPSLEFAMIEDQDYDCVTRRIEGDSVYYTPVQLKKLVAESLGPTVSLEEEIAKLEKYVDSNDLVVAFMLSRAESKDLARLNPGRASIGGLWFFGNLKPDQSRWFLYGDVIFRPLYSEFEYPA